jgi:hypothetical protein
MRSVLVSEQGLETVATSVEDAQDPNTITAWHVEDEVVREARHREAANAEQGSRSEGARRTHLGIARQHFEGLLGSSKEPEALVEAAVLDDVVCDLGQVP